ncbi:metal-dependent phosphohydrolase [Streptomyces sp. H10-C2]|uniref:metal-dependent phosphohydrolase n=1 Tax=unclassified Streptomyces TaxID=2593676 RepID=UPI0024B95FD0|nr:MULTISPECIES: metal-dependent phosphohydrolase [unclassified Streptomyces]MDJ0343087.1 metal-dependent phosphohydrolase [Streptomyces sp. PH10-H1]MDJ0372733.1 metal-dependent phosphohydrolase [Streptomyces sp. H10-C2]
MPLAPFPDSPLARAANELLLAVSPPALVAHCHRTYRFGAALLTERGRAFDAEALFIASALHDLGLTDAYNHPRTPFELHGARLAEEHLLAGGARPETVALVRDAITLHLEPETADDPRPEVAAVHLGAAADVIGARLDQLPPGLLAAVLEIHPRQHFTSYLIEVMARQAATKPTSRIGALVERTEFLDLIANAPFAD